MASIKDSLEEINKAVAENNGSVIGQYLEDKRPAVKAAANKALLAMQANPAEDNTPIPEEFKKEQESNISNVPIEKPLLRRNWIEMTEDEAAQYEKDGLLIGFDRNNGIGLIKK